MNIEEMKQHEWCISWSGGKDSTATVILCHEYGIPIKEHCPQLVKKIYDMIEMCDYSIDGLENRNTWVAQYLKDKETDI